MGHHDLWTPLQEYTDRHIASLAEDDLGERTVAQFDVPGTPPSLNKVGSKRQNYDWFKHKRQWEGMFYKVLVRYHIPRGITKARASGIVRFKDNRRRDEGNYRYLLEKALGDALALQWLPDDTPEHFRFTTLDFEKDDDPATIIVLSFIKA